VLAARATAGRPRFDIADIVRRHRPELEAQMHLTVAQRRVLSAIELCRTAALGGHLDVCASCSYEHPSYNSCRNRHCPKCQALEQERWIAARAERLLPVGHFHVVFTLPQQLRALARHAPRPLFDALFTAASQVLLELGQTHLDAKLGITMVLHTWTRKLEFHPHVHALVTAGGLATDQTRWNACSTNYLFPVRIMAALLRGKMLAALSSLHASGAFDTFADFEEPQAFARLISRVARLNWIVYAKKPFRRALHVVNYLGRYSHRVAISNSRLIHVTDTAVTFRTKNGALLTLPPLEFMRRFLRHILPDGLHKIRHYGLYAGSHVATALATAHEFLRCAQSPLSCANATGTLHWTLLLTRLTGRNPNVCPRCGQPLYHLPLPDARAPPNIAA
jgi:putative transposase/transposase-like zinc-binding protein